MLGDEIAIFALILRQKHQGGGALSIAIILAAGHLPLILLAPWAGTVADRFPVRRLVPPIALGQAGLAALLAFNTPLLISITLIGLLGAGQAFTAPAWSATLPEILTKDALPSAMSLMQAMYALAGLVGPGVAGLMVGKLGYVTPMLTNAGSFAVLGLVPLFLVLPFHARHEGPLERRDVLAGLQFVRQDPTIRALVLLMFSLTVALNAFNVASLFFALDDLHASQFIYGLTASVFAGAGFVAAIINERREVGEQQMPANVIGGSVILGLGVLLMSFSWHWALLFPTSAMVGIGGSTVSAYGFAFILQRAPDESRARVIAAVQAAMSFGTLTSLAIAGAFVPLIGARMAILSSGGASLLALAFFAPSLIRSVGKT